MDRPLLAYAHWISYTSDTKRKLARLFEIPRTGEVVVHVGEMMEGNIGASAKQDGYRPEDLYAITLEKLQALIGTEDTDFLNMVQHVLDNLDDLYYERFPEDVPAPAAEEPSPVSPAPEPVPEAEFVPRDPEELLKKNEPTVEPVLGVEPTPVEEPTIIAPKTKPYAKTSKAKAAKAK